MSEGDAPGLLGRVGTRLRGAVSGVAERLRASVSREPEPSPDAVLRGDDLATAYERRDLTLAEAATRAELSVPGTVAALEAAGLEPVDREPSTVVADTDLLVRLDNADGFGGHEALDALATSANLVVPRAVHDELGPSGRWNDRFVGVDTVPAEGPTEEMEDVWASGNVVVADRVAVDALDDDLRGEVDRRFDARLADGSLDLAVRSGSGGGGPSGARTEVTVGDVVDVDLDALGTPEEAPLELDVRDGVREEDGLGPGESGAILLADALDGTFVGNDRNARATADGLDVGATEVYATLADLTDSGRLSESTADDLVSRLHECDDLPREPMADADPGSVTLREVLNDLPDEVTAEMFVGGSPADPAAALFDDGGESADPAGPTFERVLTDRVERADPVGSGEGQAGPEREGPI